LAETGDCIRTEDDVADFWLGGAMAVKAGLAVVILEIVALSLAS
jgi:hypothetical protein